MLGFYKAHCQCLRKMTQRNSSNYREEQIDKLSAWCKGRIDKSHPAFLRKVNTNNLFLLLALMLCLCVWGVVIVMHDSQSAI